MAPREHSLARFIQLGNPGTNDLAFQSQCDDVFSFGYIVEILNMVFLGR